MRTLLTLVLSLVAGTAFAHPGSHGGEWSGLISHLLGEPDHAGLIVLALCTVAVILAVVPQRNSDAKCRSKHDPR